MVTHAVDCNSRLCGKDSLVQWGLNPWDSGKKVALRKSRDSEDDAYSREFSRACLWPDTPHTTGTSAPSVGKPKDLSSLLIEMQPNRTLARPELFNYRRLIGSCNYTSQRKKLVLSTECTTAGEGSRFRVKRSSTETSVCICVAPQIQNYTIRKASL